jgi:zinc/manganese transport system substrate-binding protein
MGDVAIRVAGDMADVSVLMPIGADPHNFEPSAQQQAQMLDADLIVASGGGLEASLRAPLAEAERAGVPVFTAAEQVELIASDPHFWMDPVRMAAAVRELGTQIDAIGEDGRGRRQADAYAAQLEELDGEVRDLLTDIADDRRTLVTNHDAFRYFAERYDFRIVGTVIPGVSTGAEPSAQDLEELARTVAREDVAAIFVETVASDDLAETLAREAGTDVEVVELYSGSLGDQGSPAATYRDMLRTDAQRISAALS